MSIDMDLFSLYNIFLVLYNKGETMKMATVFGSMVLSISALVAGCSPADISVHPAVIQGGCPPMQVVPIGSVSDNSPSPCKMAKEVESLFSGIAQVVSTTVPAVAVVTGDGASISRPKVVDKVVVKRGQGLIAATRGTKKPLSLPAAVTLGEKYNRTIWHYISVQGVVTIDVSVFTGEEFYLVEEAGKTYWVMGKMSVRR